MRGTPIGNACPIRSIVVPGGMGKGVKLVVGKCFGTPRSSVCAFTLLSSSNDALAVSDRRVMSGSKPRKPGRVIKRGTLTGKCRPVRLHCFSRGKKRLGLGMANDSNGRVPFARLCTRWSRVGDFSAASCASLRELGFGRFSRSVVYMVYNKVASVEDGLQALS